MRALHSTLSTKEEWRVCRALQKNLKTNRRTESQICLYCNAVRNERFPAFAVHLDNLKGRLTPAKSYLGSLRFIPQADSSEPTPSTRPIFRDTVPPTSSGLARQNSPTSVWSLRPLLEVPFFPVVGRQGTGPQNCLDIFEKLQIVSDLNSYIFLTYTSP